MSNNQQEVGAENIELGAPGGRAEGELLLNVTLSPKTQEFGDGGDVPSATESTLQETLMKIEMNDSSISVKSGNGRNKSESPTSKRSSKRKRKNRRRREKKAAAATSDMGNLDESGLSPGYDDGTGTENEFSQNSEDVKRDQETEAGTESETTCLEIEMDQEVSSVCVEPSLTTVTSIPEEDSMLESPSSLDSKKYEVEKECEKAGEASEETSGPTHSVETLLQIAKNKILSQILEPMLESDNNAMKILPSDLQDENSSKLVVPPCSPSSIHSMNNSGNFGGETNIISAFRHEVLEGSQKPAARNVHFDEGPPEVVSVEASSSEEPIFTLELDHIATPMENKQKAGAAITSKGSSSKETIVLAGSVGPTESATSSVASENSAASLLKGTGSSSEDVADSSPHFPSRETVDESIEEEGAQGTGEINVDAFRETIQIFKIQNPMDTQYIGNEVDSILSKSMSKFTALMGESAHDNNNPNPVYASGEKVPHPDVEDQITSPESYKINDQRTELSLPLENDFIKSERPNTSSKEIDKEGNTEEDLHTSMNTTFIVEKACDDYQYATSSRPLSPGEITPQAIPDMVSDTESVSAIGYLSIVPEEDEDEDSMPSKSDTVNDNVHDSVSKEDTTVQLPSQTNSAASCVTVIETVASVHWSPPSSGRPMDKETRPETPATIPCAVNISETESANEDESKHPVTIVEDKLMANILSSASSTKSSVSSPRCQEIDVSVAPSTSETGETGQTESDYEIEMEQEGATEAKQSVEVFTLHFPTITDALPSENNLDSGTGEQPYFETDSDYPWLPERKNSLQQVIKGKEAGGNSATAEGDRVAGTKCIKNVSVAEQKPEDAAANSDDDDKDDKGCNCGKMCVIA